MSEKIKDGGPAFPVADFDQQAFSPKNVEEAKRLLSGMSLRDYFAAQAMQAFISAYPCQGDDKNIPADFEAVANDSFSMADEMIGARNL